MPAEASAKAGAYAGTTGERFAGTTRRVVLKQRNCQPRSIGCVSGEYGGFNSGAGLRADRGGTLICVGLRSIPPQLAGIAAAIEIKRVVEMPLAAQRFVIVVALRGGEPLETFRDRLEAG